MKVILDAGHGYNTLGKRMPSHLPNAKREWELNDMIARLVQFKLTGYSNIKIIRSDDTSGQRDIAISTRRKMSEKHDVDIFISIHHNAGLNGRKGGGVVVYYDPSRPNMHDFAEHLYNAVVMRNNNRGNRANPIATKSLGVINSKNKAPVALLIENGFMDGPDDWGKITTTDYMRASAQGIAEFIIAMRDTVLRGYNETNFI